MSKPLVHLGWGQLVNLSVRGGLGAGQLDLLFLRIVSSLHQGFVGSVSGVLGQTPCRSSTTTLVIREITEVIIEPGFLISMSDGFFIVENPS